MRLGRTHVCRGTLKKAAWQTPQKTRPEGIAMASDGSCSATKAHEGKRFDRGTAAPPTRTEALLARYNKTCLVACNILQVALEAASRLQRLQSERGEQALGLTGKPMHALYAGERDDVVTVQSGLTREALTQSVEYWERVSALSADARRDLSDLLATRFPAQLLSSPGVADPLPSLLLPRRSAAQAG
jgi:hypothetical protein